MDSAAKLRCSEETDFVVLYYDQSDIEEIDENEDHSVKDDLTNYLNQPEDANTPSNSNQIDEPHSDEGLEFSLSAANEDYQERVFKPQPYPRNFASKGSELGSQSIFFIVIVFGALIFIMYLFRSPSNTHEPSAPPPGFRLDSPNHACDYSSSHTNYNSEYSRISSEPFIPLATEIKTGYSTTKRR